MAQWTPPTAPIKRSGGWTPPTKPIKSKFESINIFKNKPEDLSVDLSGWADRSPFDPNEIKMNWEEQGIEDPEKAAGEAVRARIDLAKTRQPLPKPAAPSPFEYAKADPYKNTAGAMLSGVLDPKFSQESRMRDFASSVKDITFNDIRGQEITDPLTGKKNTIAKEEPFLPEAPDSLFKENIPGQIAKFGYNQLVRPMATGEGVVGMSMPGKVPEGMVPSSPGWADRGPAIAEMEGRLAGNRGAYRIPPQKALPSAPIIGGPSGGSGQVKVGALESEAERRALQGMVPDPSAQSPIRDPYIAPGPYPPNAQTLKKPSGLGILDADYQVLPQERAVPPVEMPVAEPIREPIRQEPVRPEPIKEPIRQEPTAEMPEILREKPDEILVEPPETVPPEAPKTEAPKYQGDILSDELKKNNAELREITDTPWNDPNYDKVQARIKELAQRNQAINDELVKLEAFPGEVKDPNVEALREVFEPKVEAMPEASIEKPPTKDFSTVRNKDGGYDLIDNSTGEVIESVSAPSEADIVEHRFREAMNKKETAGRVKPRMNLAEKPLPASEVFPVEKPVVEEVPAVEAMPKDELPSFQKPRRTLSDETGAVGKLPEGDQRVGRWLQSKEPGSVESPLGLGLTTKGKPGRPSLTTRTPVEGMEIQAGEHVRLLREDGSSFWRNNVSADEVAGLNKKIASGELRVLNKIDKSGNEVVKETLKDLPATGTAKEVVIDKAPYGGGDLTRLGEENRELKSLMGEVKDKEARLAKVNAPPELLRDKVINPKPKLEPVISAKTGEPLPPKKPERAKPKLVTKESIAAARKTITPKPVEDVTGIKLTEEAPDIITATTLPEGRAGETGKMLLRNANNRLEKIFKGTIPNSVAETRKFFADNPEFAESVGKQTVENIATEIRKAAKFGLEHFTHDNVPGQRENLEKIAAHLEKMADGFEKAAVEDLPQALFDVRNSIEKSVGGIVKKPSRWLNMLEGERGSMQPDLFPTVAKGGASKLKEGAEKVGLGEMLDEAKRSIDEHGVVSTIGNTMKSGMSTADVSAPFRQGASLMHKKAFRENIKPMMEMLADEDNYKAAMKAIEKDPIARFGMEHGLDLTGVTGVKEERFLRTEILEKTPGYGRVVKASDRAYNGFLTKLRADSFKSLVSDAIKGGAEFTEDLAGNKVLKDKDLATEIASFLNEATGRGNVGKASKHAENLNAIMFSPRYLKSRIDMLRRINPLDPKFYTQGAFVRKEAIKSAASLASFNLLVNGITTAAGGKVTYDIYNSDFAKNKIGNTRVSFDTGYMAPIILMARIRGGKYTSPYDNKSRKLGDAYGQTGEGDLIWRFLRSKESPLVGAAAELWTGKDWSGNEQNRAAGLIRKFVPMVLTDLEDIVREDPKLAPLIIPAALGASVQTFDKPKRKSKGLRMPSMNFGNVSMPF